jgi:H+/gluconate symporter-like permease
VLSLCGLILGLALLIALTMRGASLFIAAPFCALIVAAAGSLPLLPALSPDGKGDLLTLYMGGFSGFIAKWFAMFLLGSIFGKLMEDAGAAASVAHWIVRRVAMRLKMTITTFLSVVLLRPTVGCAQARAGPNGGLDCTGRGRGLGRAEDAEHLG